MEILDPVLPAPPHSATKQLFGTCRMTDQVRLPTLFSLKGALLRKGRLSVLSGFVLVSFHSFLSCVSRKKKIYDRLCIDF